MRIAVFGFAILAVTAGTAAAQKAQTVYLISEYTVVDPEGMKEFGAATTPLVEKNGGQFLSRRGSVSQVAGDEPPKSVTIVQFPDLAKAQAYYQSAEFKAAAPLREKAATKFRSYIVDGGDQFK